MLSDRGENKYFELLLTGQDFFNADKVFGNDGWKQQRLFCRYFLHHNKVEFHCHRNETKKM
jgi:hypothetical protein